jgi:pimeloyl-ACP methyl ester carboxylesterase
MSTRLVHLEPIGGPGPAGAPVLCLHGLFAGPWVYERVLPLLAARGHPASALSFRGHPPSTARREVGRISIARYLDDAIDAARGLDRPVVVGHSLGGLVALMLAARGLVRAAVLVSPAPPRGITVLGRPLLMRMWRYVPAMLFSRPFLPTADDLDALVLNRVPERERAAIRARMVADSGRAALQAAVGAVAVPVSAVRVPLFVMASDDDRFIPAGVGARVAARYGAPLHLARGHGHFLFGEPGWEEHAAVMLDWIDACAATRDEERGTRHEGRGDREPAAPTAD